MPSKPRTCAFLVASLWLGSVALAQETDIETKVVDSMNKVFGSHPGFRATHAKGVVVEGSFRGSPEGAALSRSALFGGTTIPVTVRFSDNTGLPDIPDGIADANPHGMAIKFRLPDGSETDMVTNSLKFFPVKTVAEFRDLLEAIIASPKDAPKPTKFEQFLETHPRVVPAVTSTATPDSFAHEEYRGVNAFVLVSKSGERRPVRYLISPEAVVHLEARDATARAPDFLVTEIADRLKGGPVTFRIRAQLGEPGDQTVDPSLPWPDDRKLAELGVLTLDKVVPNSLEAQKALSFFPGALTDGIEASDDPMIDIRTGAYAVSVTRRQ